MSNICNFDRILKTECNLQHFIRNCRIKNFDDFEKDEAEVLFVGSRTSKCEGEKDDQMLHYKQVFGNVSERRKSKCCGVLIKHCRKVKGEQVITLQRVSLKPPINRPPTTDHLPTDRPTTDHRPKAPTTDQPVIDQ